MSQVSAGAAVSQVAASASASEKSASSQPAPATTPSSSAKLRSCVVCRSRKVRCDKQSPCFNCRRANIACVLPSSNRPPRWARRLLHLSDNAAAASTARDADPSFDQVMDRMRDLENLVKDLNRRLETARASPDGDTGQQIDLSPAMNTSTVQKQFGRLVLQDASRSRYVSSGFWSRVNDELNGIQALTRGLAGDELESSEDEDEPSLDKTPFAQVPWERHAFLFRENLSPSTPDLREFYPLPSQIPFLLEIFSENVNLLIQVVHIPTLTKIVRGWRGCGMANLTPANQALMFSIYYAAIASMEDDEVMTNFGSSKTDLSLKFRLGLEHALTKADFLNVPDLVLIQAFTIFVLLVRRNDSPTFVWMMTGLVVRMAQYLGLQRDGTHFEHLSPFDIEIRRRVWWVVCLVDMRASEDQGTDLTITNGSFDTKIPLNINDADISPESEQMPAERDGLTDMSFPRISVRLYYVMRQIMALGVNASTPSLEGQSRLLNEIYQKYEQGYLQYTTESGITYWFVVTIARLVLSKMTLIAFLPVLFSSPSDDFSNEVRTKLLVSAIEVAEYNHALNAEQICLKWHWICQTYTHWHAIVYVLIEIARRPWSPIVERAWVALHSGWLVPSKGSIEKNPRIWVPLRKLRTKARKHRDAELVRLRADPQAATTLEKEDEKIPSPSSCGPFPTGSKVDVVQIFRERWRQLVAMPEGPKDSTQTPGISSAGIANPLIRTSYHGQPPVRAISAYSPGDLSSNMAFEPTYLASSGQQTSHTLDSTDITDIQPAIMTNASSEETLGQTVGPSLFPTAPAEWPDASAIGVGFAPFLWADADPSADLFSNFDVDSADVSMNLGTEVNWHDWIISARDVEQNTQGPNGNSQT